MDNNTVNNNGSYGSLRQRQIFICHYEIHYPSGKIWKAKRETTSYSEKGAEAILEWLHKPRRGNGNLIITKIIPTGIFVGDPIYPCYDVNGDW